METKQTAHGQGQEARTARRAYHSPRLTECGSVGDLTQTSPSSVYIEYDQTTPYVGYVSSPI